MAPKNLNQSECDASAKTLRSRERHRQRTTHLSQVEGRRRPASAGGASSVSFGTSRVSADPAAAAANDTGAETHVTARGVHPLSDLALHEPGKEDSTARSTTQVEDNSLQHLAKFA